MSRIISDREQREWIPGCPVQVKRVSLTSTPTGPMLTVTILPCGGFAVKSVEVSILWEDVRRKQSSVTESVVLSTGTTKLDLDGAIPSWAVYGYVTVRRVVSADGTAFENLDGGRGTVLPEQQIIWQTDPFYEGIRFGTAGVVDACYYPDAPAEGAWRCTCGQVNLVRDNASEEVCGACGCGKAWLDEHFSEEYLANATKESAEKGLAAKKATRKPKKTPTLSDKGKFILILVALALVIGLIVAAPTIGKIIRYHKAEDYLAAGEFDKAIAEFAELGEYSDAATRLQKANYKKAQWITGIDDVNMVWSSRAKWYSITPDGVLSFRSDNYTGDWERFVIPDVVDGVVVRELDKNFFINCKDLRTVVISDCVEVLGEGTFFNCESLTSVEFGKNVRQLGARCFINCTSLREMTVPDTVVKIGLRAFNSCSRLTTVTLGKGITVIPSYLFSDCMSLTSVTVKGALTEIGEYAFAQCPSFRELICCGAESDFASVVIAGNNEELQQAIIRFAEEQP